ncbi:MAG: hypothetical protein COB31_02980 [Erythrobacter sp.]|nr:MAG: hypothetical protein COB31_02980 [Erythrobacter sp.]
MKIGVGRIFLDHLKSLYDAKTGRVSATDLFVFYGCPSIFAILVYLDQFSFEDGVYNQSIAVFAIFSALLFSVQIALFGIYSKEYSAKDEFSELYAQARVKKRRKIIRQTNSNISYLIVISSLSVTLFLAASVIRVSDRFEPALAIFLYSHFMLTLLMVIKRVHALFDKEYQGR